MRGRGGHIRAVPLPGGPAGEEEREAASLSFPLTGITGLPL
ncbi:hypothetical protein AB0F42_33970 [Streptomyces buecherae]